VVESNWRKDRDDYRHVSERHVFVPFVPFRSADLFRREMARIDMWNCDEAVDSINGRRYMMAKLWICISSVAVVKCRDKVVTTRHPAKSPIPPTSVSSPPLHYS